VVTEGALLEGLGEQPPNFVDGLLVEPLRLPDQITRLRTDAGQDCAENAVDLGFGDRAGVQEQAVGERGVEQLHQVG
jgi:hypothetical protein